MTAMRAPETTFHTNLAAIEGRIDARELEEIQALRSEVHYQLQRQKLVIKNEMLRLFKKFSNRIL